MSAYMVGVQQDQAAQQQQPPGGGEDENYGLPDSDAPYFPGAANKPPALPAPGGGGQPQVPGVAPGRPALPAPGSGPPRPVPGGAGRPGAPAVGLAKARQPGRLTVTIRELPPDEARGW
jgi:hypothetical protein